MRATSTIWRQQIADRSNLLQGISWSGSTSGAFAIAELQQSLLSNGDATDARLTLLSTVTKSLRSIKRAAEDYSRGRANDTSVDPPSAMIEAKPEPIAGKGASLGFRDTRELVGRAADPSAEPDCSDPGRPTALNHVRMALRASEHQCTALQLELSGTERKLRRSEQACGEALRAAGQVPHYQAAVARLDQLCAAADARVKAVLLDKQAAELESSALRRQVARLLASSDAREALAPALAAATAHVQSAEVACSG